IELDLQLEELPRIKANKKDWIEVWVNLIKNAVEALNSHQIQNPKITVASKYLGAHICVSITDNGPGIPQSLQSKIFRPNVTTKVNGLTFGLGLGLSIVQKIVQSYSGEIELQSKPWHTEFLVRIPAH
ncbi:MAG: ATP-binding protein, partial [Bacteroidota bacterium]